VSDPVARSPIAPTPPVEIRHGWAVSTRASSAALTLSDVTPLTKVTVRAPEGGTTAAALGVPFGRTRRDADVLLIGSGPDEWLVVGAVDTTGEVTARLHALADDGEHVSIVDVTHGRALVRLSGEEAADLLSRICAIDLADTATPDGTALRTSIANLVVDLVRDDRDGIPSYLLHCERSSGQYLYGALTMVGAEFDLDITGFDNRP
jgi:sarcosine oxidase, subunit gamma